MSQKPSRIYELTPELLGLLRFSSDEKSRFNLNQIYISEGRAWLTDGRVLAEYPVEAVDEFPGFPADYSFGIPVPAILQMQKPMDKKIKNQRIVVVPGGPKKIRLSLDPVTTDMSVTVDEAENFAPIALIRSSIDTASEIGKILFRADKMADMANYAKRFGTMGGLLLTTLRPFAPNTSMIDLKNGENVRFDFGTVDINNRTDIPLCDLQADPVVSCLGAAIRYLQAEEHGVDGLPHQREITQINALLERYQRELNGIVLEEKVI